MFQDEVVAKMLKAIHSQESKKAGEKAMASIEELKQVKLKDLAEKLEKGIEETLTYMALPYEHWTKIRTTNLVERINRHQAPNQSRRHLPWWKIRPNARLCPPMPCYLNPKGRKAVYEYEIP